MIEENLNKKMLSKFLDWSKLIIYLKKNDKQILKISCPLLQEFIKKKKYWNIIINTILFYTVSFINLLFNLINL